VQAELATAHASPVLKLLMHACWPSTLAESYQTVHVLSMQGLASTAPYPPSQLPLEHATHAAAEVLPTREYGVDAGQAVHEVDPAALYCPALHRVCKTQRMRVWRRGRRSGGGGSGGRRAQAMMVPRQHSRTFAMEQCVSVCTNYAQAISELEGKRTILLVPARAWPAGQTISFSHRK
jgi:hypothetical protein